MKYNILIIEDEFPTRELLKSYLSDIPEILQIGTAANGQEAMEKISTAKFDIIFLDINLPDISGMELMKKISSIKNTFVIFSTAYNQYALEALDAGAVDYLLKPYSQERFKQAMEKAMIFLKNSVNSQELTIKTINQSPAARVIIPIEEIIYLSSNGKHTVFHSNRGDYETPGLLKEYLDILPESMFLRIHKQHIVNRSYISGISYANGGSWNLLLKDNDDTLLPVGKMFATSLKKVFES